MTPTRTSSARRRLRHLIAALATPILFTPLAFAQTTGFNQTAGGTYAYNDTANWVGGDINGIWDASLTVTGTQTVTIGAGTTLSNGLNFGYDGAFNVSLIGDGVQTVTLGGDITVNTVASSRVIQIGTSNSSNDLNIDLGGATRALDVTSGRTLRLWDVVSNGGLVVSGGSLEFYGANTYAGSTTINSGTLALVGSTGSAADSDFFIRANNASSTSSLSFTGSSGTGATRAKSVTLDGGWGTAQLSVTGNTSNNTIETITGALTSSRGNNIVSISPTSSKNIRLSAGSFVRDQGATTYFRGTNLGLNTLASQTANSSNIEFTNAPALIGGGGTADSSTIGIIAGAYGGTTSNSSIGEGLVTYDSTYGVRLLNTATEYTSTITSGQSQLDNVLLQRASGGGSQDVNLTDALTTINSLSFKITGAGTNSGVTIGGDAGTTLRINSGTIFASQQVSTANATDAMILNVPTLDLNGQEGVIIAFTNGISNGNTTAPLQINSVITNDGGNGVTIGGTGQVIFGGSEANTYTGVTTLNSGILRLAKSVTDIGLTTDLIINGGTLLKNTNAIADTANVTINGGTFWMDTTSSSGNNGHSETINNFTLNGGAFGNHGSNASFTINGDATLNARDLGMNQGGDITVLGNTFLNGGRLLARESSSDTVANGLTNLNTLSIVNQASGAYTAMTLNAHATRQGARVTLNGDVTFTGNGTNTNTVLIDSSDTGLANQGVIALEGTRTFDIGDGAASVDLSIVPAMTDGSVAGGLIKTGAGTLSLGGINTYTGATTVNAGTLLLGADNRIAATSALVMNGGTFATGGFNQTLGTLTLSANSTIDLGDGASFLEFADSSGAVWADSVSLSFVNFTEGVDSIRFGGLTGSQLAKITLNGFNAEIDVDGYLAISAIPEPASHAFFAGAGVLVLCLRRRNRASRAA